MSTTPSRDLTEAERAELRAFAQKAAAEAQKRRDEMPDPFANTLLARPAKPTKEQPR